MSERYIPNARSPKPGSKEWWASKKDKYPFHAKSPTSVSPVWVEGNHASVVLTAGWRTWGFETVTERDAFVSTYHGFAL